jgi:hypothetical protein
MWTLWESRVLCEISKPLWARSLRPQGWQRPHRVRRHRNVNRVGRCATPKKGDTQIATPSRKSLLGHPERSFDRADRRDPPDHAQRSVLRPDRKRCSKTAGLT